MVVLSCTLITPKSGLAQGKYPVDVVKIEEDVSENSVDIKVTLRSNGFSKTGTLRAGSPSTGYKSLQVTLSPNQEETYQLTGFQMTEPSEEFEITLKNQGVNLIEPRHITVETTGEEAPQGGEQGYWNFVKNNIFILAGIVVITIVGIILITPFIYHEEGTKPFKEDLSLEEIKEGEE